MSEWLPVIALLALALLLLALSWLHRTRSGLPERGWFTQTMRTSKGCQRRLSDAQLGLMANPTTS